MRAAIDVGSNSLLLLIVDKNGQPIHDEARVVGLGKGLGDRGVFRQDRMEAAIACFKDFAEKLKRAGVAPEQVRAVATSASRRALNANTFYAQVRAQTGIRVDVISGEEEARLTWLGGISGMDLPSGPIALVDPGGGSTEVIYGESDRIRYHTSLEIGSVRLTESFIGYHTVEPGAFSRLRNYVEETVYPLEMPGIPRTVIAVAGTATTLAAMDLGLSTYDPAKVHGSTLTLTALRRHVDRLLEASPEERRQLVAVSPERADTILAGAVILIQILEKTRRQAFRISDRGLRYGLLARH